MKDLASSVISSSNSSNIMFYPASSPTNLNGEDFTFFRPFLLEEPGVRSRFDEPSQAVKDAGVLYGVFRGVTDGVFHRLVTF